MKKIWLVTGAGRGLGLEIARAALTAGDTVVATARSTDRLAGALGPDGERLLGVPLDVTDATAAIRAAQTAVDRFGRIDVLVNNAGQAQLGWFETISDAHVRQQFETNVFGAMNVARAVLPHMRARRAGLLVTISSASGLFSTPGGTIYSASKFALEGWVEGLAQEIAPVGIRSLVIEPGTLRTDFLDPSSARHGDVAIADYAEAVATFESYIAATNHAQLGDPATLAARIVALAALASPPARHVFGEDALGWVTAKLDTLGGEVRQSAAYAARAAA